MKKTSQKSNYVRVTVSIPKNLWPFFERQKNLPQHSGNRSSFVRGLILEKMRQVKAKAA